MAQISQFGLQGLMPSQDSPAFASTTAVQLPWGGPYGVGGAYSQGAVLSIVAGTIQSEVITVSIAGSTGDILFTFYGDTIYQCTFAYNASLAVAQAALEDIFGVDCVTVTGTPGTTYTITFSGTSANRRIGGLVTVSASTSGTPTVARTTRGSSGAGQYDLYDSSTFTVVAAFLEYGFSSTPQGCVVTNIPSSGQPSSMPAWNRGRFFVSDLPSTGTNALDTDALTNTKNLFLIRGTALTDVGAQVELS